LISTTIIRHLIHNYEYGKKVIPFLSTDYFSGGERIIFSIINNYTKKYGEFPSLEAISVDLSNLSTSTDNFEIAKETLIATAEPEEGTSLEWLMDNTEQFCQEAAISNALIKCMQIQNGEEKGSNGDFPRILTDALAVSFDTNLGHDYFLDAEKQFNYYHDVRKRIPWGIKKFDHITKGGLLPKTINMFMASTGVGKSLVMSSCAAGHLMMGKNVLYFTMEMSEEMIRQRIDANLMNIDIDLFETITKEKYFSILGNVHGKTRGQLIVKEYPSGSANVDHFEHFLNELRIKRKIIPHVIYVDYMNICSSNRVKADMGSYGYIKSITQELRAMAQRHDLPIVSATQTNRGGYENNDIDMGDISESFGTGHEVDLLLGIMQPPELVSVGQFMIKQFKSRYGDINKTNSFVIGVDKSKMRIYDLEDGAQWHKDKPVADQPRQLIKQNAFADWQ
jgi:archaellum biogenesis ATPase FlaH